jgi:hypothetical protein
VEASLSYTKPWVNKQIAQVNFGCVCVAALGFELRASHLLGRHSTAGGMPSALFALGILEIGSCFCLFVLPRLVWVAILLF